MKIYYVLLFLCSHLAAMDNAVDLSPTQYLKNIYRERFLADQLKKQRARKKKLLDMEMQQLKLIILRRKVKESRECAIDCTIL